MNGISNLNNFDGPVHNTVMSIRMVSYRYRRIVVMQTTTTNCYTTAVIIMVTYLTERMLIQISYIVLLL